MFADTIRKAVA